MKKILIIFFALTTSNIFCQDGVLIVNIKGISPISGYLNIGIFDKSNDFPNIDEGLTGKIIKVDSSEIIHKFEKLNNGSLAIAVFHDENSNGKLDKNFLGIPKEEYVFSNYTKSLFGPPSFESAKFEFNDSLVVELDISK